MRMQTLEKKDDVQVIITTSFEPDEKQIQTAARCAAALGKKSRYVERRQMTLAQLRTRFGGTDVLVCTRERLEVHSGEKPPLFFHPSMSMIRVKRLLQGESDPLIQLADIGEGDRIVDCTAGLGSDAILFSFAAGETGQVTALESSAVPYVLLKQGLSSYVTHVAGLQDAMRRIKVVHEHHLAYLKRLEPGSVDVVYFDPMFRIPIHESSSMRAVRDLTNNEALCLEAVEAARSAARRCVIMKEHRASQEFDRLGFEEIFRTSNKIAYGVIRC